MKNRTLQIKLLATLILASACIAGCTANEKKLAETGEDKDDFVSIFDGKTLKGWRALPAQTAPAWTVKNGMIVGDGDKGKGYLTFENAEIADLEIKLSYRFGDKGNSGISIRARQDKTGKRHFQSYHADFGHVGIGKQVLGAWDFHTPGRKEHACFRGDRLVIDENDKPKVTRIEGAVTREDINKGDWNKVHVIAKGNNFKFFINGKLSSEFTEHLPTEKRLHRGMIQLQLHDPGMIVHFKDIRLKIPGSVGKLDLASSGLFSAWLHPAASTIEPTSPASPSLPGEKPLALGPTTEFSDRAYNN